MRCKAGDLAVVVKSNCGNEGKVVRCLRYLGTATPDTLVPFIYDDAWEVEPGLMSNHGYIVPIASDSQLRPLRADERDADETLTWAGKPADMDFPEWTQ